MADETTEQDEPTTGTEPHGDGTDWKAQARKWQQRARDNREEARALREQAKERADYDEVAAERDRLASEVERLGGEIARRDLVARVSEETGVPAGLLHGETAEELAASAAAVTAYVESRMPAWPADKGGGAKAAPVTHESIDRGGRATTAERMARLMERAALYEQEGNA